MIHTVVLSVTIFINSSDLNFFIHALVSKKRNSVLHVIDLTKTNKQRRKTVELALQSNLSLLQEKKLQIKK